MNTQSGLEFNWKYNREVNQNSNMAEHFKFCQLNYFEFIWNSSQVKELIMINVIEWFISTTIFFFVSYGDTLHYLIFPLNLIFHNNSFAFIHKAFKQFLPASWIHCQLKAVKHAYIETLQTQLQLQFNWINFCTFKQLNMNILKHCRELINNNFKSID